ncbi:MAG: nucleotidyltransferase family protein [Cyanobacteriota bacterium]
MTNITAIVLAAGLSTRMGKFKQLLPYKNKTVITHIVDEIIKSDISEIIVVTGYNKELIEKELVDHKINLVYNQYFQQGMHTSVITGVNKLSNKTDAFMLFLGDQPEINFNLINNLILFFNSSCKGIIIPSYLNKRGHPVLFDKKYIDVARNTNPDTGLKQLLNDYPEDIEYFISQNDSILFDIDTPKDYNELLQR